MNEKEFFNLHHKLIYGMNEHPYHMKRGIVYEHRLKVERKIGRYLTSKEEVHHHYNADSSVNFILCPNRQYHMLLHMREKALRYCGHANWRICTHCKQHDDPKNLSITNSSTYHKLCAIEYRRNSQNE